jgi:hypothetical protein
MLYLVFLILLHRYIVAGISIGVGAMAPHWHMAPHHDNLRRNLNFSFKRSYQIMVHIKFGFGRNFEGRHAMRFMERHWLMMQGKKLADPTAQ